MNWRINSIEINNFKFFKELFRLNINGKNLLMYGENGSGKSSIYWAFYTIFQSCYKKPTPNEAQKYFIHDRPENLRNKFSAKNDSSGIKIELISDRQNIRVYEDSDKVCNTHVVNDTLMTLSAGSSDFLNYKFLAEVLDFKNSEENDIFNIIMKDVLPSMICSTKFAVKYVKQDEHKTLVFWWKYINTYIVNLPRSKRSPLQFNQGSQLYKDFQILVDDFNSELNFQLQSLQEEVNKKLENDFKIPVKIKLSYSPVLFNKKIQGTVKGYDGLVHNPKVILSALMTNKRLENGPVAIPRPKSFFNEAKLTCIALALRLAVVEMRYKGKGAASALFIDDLLLSLDMGRRLQVIDVILRLKDRYQLVIFTHDRAFYEILSAKIHSLPNNEAENWLEKEIFAQEESLCLDGIPSHFMLEKDDYLDKSILYMYKCDLPASANYLRKAVEHELKRLYPTNWIDTIVPKNGIDRNASTDLSGLILKLPSYYKRYGMDCRQSNIDIHRKRLLNPLSHDDLHTPIYRGELMDCINEVKWLRKFEVEDVVKSEDEIRYNCYCIEGSNGSRSIKVILRFKEVFNYVRIPDGKNINIYHSNSIIEVLSCSVPSILKTDANREFYVNGLYNVVIEYLGYTNEAKPAFNHILKQYPLQNQIADIVGSIYFHSINN